jgi:uncharacterized membrane protein YheB (UPF0754 family)
MISRVNLKGQKLQSDNVFPTVEIKSFSEAIKLKTKAGYDNIVTSDGEVVNVCSKKYALLKNEDFFLKVEEKLIDADIQYDMRSINRKNSSFQVDYILNDDRYDIIINNRKKDVIKPMLSFINSYDGSCKTKGSFGYFRQVCTNGLHIAETVLDFTVKHRGNMAEIVFPKMDNLIEQFMNNEYYTLKEKATLLGKNKLSDIGQFVKDICDKTDVFKYKLNPKNKVVSPFAQQVINTVISEAKYLRVEPNMWLTYNAFNEILNDGTFTKTFDKQHEFDGQIFNTILEMAN